MLTSYRGQQHIERIVTDAYGRRFRMVFAVNVVNGELKGRLISVISLDKQLTLSGSTNKVTYCLPITCSNEVVFSNVVNYQHFVSPYHSNSFLIHSQPTRAPSFC
jgi:hypothetical protein